MSPRRTTALALGLAVALTGTGVLHFTATAAFARIVPHAFPNPELLVQASGVAELSCAALLAVPRTRRLGGWAAAALFVAVFPANVQMALDGGYAGASGIAGSPALAWARLPFQLPLIAAAVAVARQRGSVAAAPVSTALP